MGGLPAEPVVAECRVADVARGTVVEELWLLIGDRDLMREERHVALKVLATAEMTRDVAFDERDSARTRHNAAVRHEEAQRKEREM